MPHIRLLSIVESIAGNFATSAISSAYHRIDAALAIKHSIADAATEHPFSDAGRVLAVWVKEFDFETRGVDRLRADDDSEWIAKYQSIAQVCGAPSDETIAETVIGAFLVALDRRLLDLASHEKRDQERFETLHSAVRDLSARLNSGSEGRIAPSSSDSTRLAVVQTLIDCGQILAARQKLADLSSSTPQDLDEAFNRSMLDGVCSYYDENFHGALAAFQGARLLKPQNSKVASNLAATYIALNDYEQAVAHARLAASLDEATPPTNLIIALHLQNNDREAIDLARLDKWKAEPTVLLALARIYGDVEQWDDAITTARASLASRPSIEGREALAISLLGRNGFLRSRTSREDVIEAISLLTDCITERRGWTGSNRDYQRLLINRGVAHALVNDSAAALNDCETALSEGPSDDAIALKARLLGATDRWEEANQLFASIKDSDIRRQTAAARAYTLCQLHRPQDAVDVVRRSLLADTIPDDAFLEIVHVGILAAKSADDSGTLEYLVALSAEKPDWVSKAVQGYSRLREPLEAADAIATLIAAAETAPSAERPLLDANVLRALLRADRARDAIRYYESLSSPRVDLELAESYASALYKVHAYEKLIAFARDLETRGLKSRRIDEARAAIFEQIGSLEDAAAIYETLAVGRDTRRLLVAARVRARLGDLTKVRELLERVNVADILDSPRDLIALASLNDTVGIPPLAVAYRALHLAKTPDVCGEYVRLVGKWLRRETVELTVSANTTVTLGGDSKSVITLSDEPLDASLPSHFATSSPIGAAILGKKCGESVVIPLAQRTVSLIVIGVSNKFHYTLDSEVQSAPARFGRLSPIVPVANAVSDEEAQRRAAPQRAKLENAYSARRLSIGRLADRVDAPLVSVFNHKLVSAGCRIHAFSGTDDEASAECEALSVTNSAVLDLTALLTLARVNLLESLTRVFETIFVAQFVIDQLLIAQDQIFALRRDGVVCRAMPTADGVVPLDWDDFDQEYRILKRALDFVKASTRVVGCPELLAMPLRSIVSEMRLFGRVTFSSFSVANARGASLIVDDVVSRRAATERGVRSASSRAVVEVLSRRGLLACDAYLDAMLSFAELNVGFLSVSVEDLFRLLSRSGDDGTSFVQLASQLAGPEADLWSVVTVAAGLLVKVWTSEIPFDIKVRATITTLIASTFGRQLSLAFKIRDRTLSEIAVSWFRSQGQLNQSLGAFIQICHSFVEAGEATAAHSRK